MFIIIHDILGCSRLTLVPSLAAESVEYIKFHKTRRRNRIVRKTIAAYLNVNPPFV